MFGWRSRESELEQARVRQAFRKRLAEVLGLPEEGSALRQVSPQARLERALEPHAAPELSRSC